jgi:hypothetical protein
VQRLEPSAFVVDASGAQSMLRERLRHCELIRHREQHGAGGDYARTKESNTKESNLWFLVVADHIGHDRRLVDRAR